MTSHFSGNFRAKHPPDTRVDPSIMDRVATKLVQGCMACKTAHTIAVELNIAPSEVGIAIDLQNGRIKACQLGLFGFSKGKKVVAQDKAKIDSELQSTIRAKLIDSRLPCETAWRIADAHGIARLEFGQICENLAIKINQCQLGAF
jgi:hypothetical protein